MADVNKLTRIFVNLIKNAVDAMPNGGTLSISSVIEDSKVKIHFSDTGIGIPEDVLPKLFAPLFTTKAQGMGFGLAICKRNVEAHGGTITVKTALEKGTTFTVTIPIETKLKCGGD
jgi:signal transduction histidine kinase